MKKIFRNIMMLMTVPFMLMTSACESMDDYQCGSNPYEYC